MIESEAQVVYWHRELPPVEAELVARVHSESIEPKHDDAAGEAWLHGRVDYILYRRPQKT
jgi:hypothetical protein